MEFEIVQKELQYKKPARTSRGEYITHNAYYISIVKDSFAELKFTKGSDPLVNFSSANQNYSRNPSLNSQYSFSPLGFGIGECAPLPDLSCDRDAYPNVEAVRKLVEEAFAADDMQSYLAPYPALRFAIESAMAEARHDAMLYSTPFARGEEGIPFNGLVWMSSFDDMLSQVKSKIEQGFRCVKLKIGAIDWEREIELIRYIRSHYTCDEIELRVDANCAFSLDVVEERLNQLAKYDIHSIEQPIACRQWDALHNLCKHSPLPIALDEELIGLNYLNDKCEMLDAIHPHYIVLKPTLHGGITGTREWVDEANRRGISSWITSALESNVGLRHVAILAASIYGPDITFPQGLGTGLLFTSNIDTGIKNDGTRLYISLS